MRLYSEEDYASRPAQTPPEIVRSDLSDVLLAARSMRLGPVNDLPFLDPPRAESLKSAEKSLVELQAVDEAGRLTMLGKQIARLPTSPRVGRMLVAAADFGCLQDLLPIAAALETADPRTTNEVEEHAELAACRHPESDFATLLQLWRRLAGIRQDLSHSGFKRACGEIGLSFARVQEWTQTHRQLRLAVRRLGLHLDEPSTRGPFDYENIHRALLTGLLHNVACRIDRRRYRIAGGGVATTWPGSAADGGKWVIAAEIVHTSQRFLRTTARVQRGWIEQAAVHLLQRKWIEPFWDERSNRPMVFENASLAGLRIVHRRHTPLGPHLPEIARELLIQQGLVQGRLTTKGKFLAANQQMIESLKAEEAKLRRAVAPDEPTQFTYYDNLIPAHVHDGASFERWRRQAEQGNRKLLFMRRMDVAPRDVPSVTPTNYPNKIMLGGEKTPLRYRFAPGAKDDGVSLRVTKRRLGHLDPAQLDWLPRGWLLEKLIALVRAMPKEIRRAFTPIQETCAAAARLLHDSQGDFLFAASEALSEASGRPVAPQSLRLERLPDHLRVRIELVDERSRIIASSRNAAELLSGRPSSGTDQRQQANRRTEVVSRCGSLESDGRHRLVVRRVAGTGHPQRRRSAANLASNIDRPRVERADDVATRCGDRAF